MIPFVNLKATHARYRDEIDAAMKTVVDNGSFILGPDVATVEADLQAFTGAPHALTCKSGTSALMLALRAIDIQPGDEVITTPFTFIATGEMISFLGAVPVYVDIDETTYNIDPAQIEAKITPKTKAIMPVSLYGQMADMDAINEIATRHNLVVIEDAAQSFGASYKGKRSCNASTLAATSFFPAKPLGVFGDGGAVFTDNAEYAEKIKVLRNHGQTKRYHHEEIGNNERLDTLQAAVLRVKLAYYEADIKRRQASADRYTAAFQSLTDTVVLPTVLSDNSSVFAQYSLRVPNRDAFQKALQEKNVPTAVHYPKPLHIQPCFLYLGGKEGDFPTSEKISNEIVSLPICCDLSVEDQDIVIEAVLQTLK